MGASDKHEFATRRSADGRVELTARAALADELVARGLLDERPLERVDGAQPCDFAGRGASVRLVVGGVALVAKSMRHGGLLRGLLGACFLGRARLRRLLDATRHAIARGVATPPIAFARARAGRGLAGSVGVVALDVATDEVADAVDAARLLGDAAHAAPATRRAALRALAGVVRALHHAGVEHADLNATNLLLRVGGDGAAQRGSPPDVEAFVVDLDRARVHPSLPRAAAVGNLARLLRSTVKLGLAGAALSTADLARFVRDYAGEEEWRRCFRETRARFDATAAFHRASWRLRSGRAARG